MPMKPMGCTNPVEMQANLERFKARRAAESTIRGVRPDLTVPLTSRGSAMTLPAFSAPFPSPFDFGFNTTSPLSSARGFAVPPAYLDPSMTTRSVAFPDASSSQGTGIAGSRLIDYEIGSQIGAGAYAVCKLAQYVPTGQVVAMKIYEKNKLLDSNKRKAVKREIQILERIKHPNILLFVDAMDSSRHLYIVTEYVSGGSLHGLIKCQPERRLPECVARGIFGQILEALQYLHERSVIHRDIKLENVLLEGGMNFYNPSVMSFPVIGPHGYPKIKLIDFGFATVLCPDRPIKMFCGTPSYMPPEVVNKESVGTGTDIWSAGVLLYALICGYFPYKGATDKELYRAISSGLFTCPNHVGESTRNFLSGLMQVDQTKRWTASKALKSSWMNEEESGSSTEASTSIGVTPAVRVVLSPRVMAGPPVASKPRRTVPPVASGPPAQQSVPMHVVPSPRDKAVPVACLDTQRTVKNLPELEEAVARLEKLGYQRKVIVQQLQDPNSHLYKLYHRFLKAVNAWN